MGEPRLRIVKDEKPSKKVEIPSLEEFKKYAYAKIKKKGDDPLLYTDWLEDKYEAWEEAGWKKEKQGKFVEIKMWKTTLLQCLAYRQRNKTTKEVQRVKPLNYNTGKLMEIEKELIVSAWHHWKVMGSLKLKHEECFDFLLQMGIFKKGKEIIDKPGTKFHGKEWNEWYATFRQRAALLALGYAAEEQWSIQDIQRIKRMEDPIIERFVKLEVLTTYFKRFETENQIKNALK